MKKNLTGAVVFEPCPPKVAHPVSMNMTQQLKEYKSASKEERKISANLKYFTSQITNELPGPKMATSNTNLYALSRLDEKLQQEHQKEVLTKTDERKVVKNHIFYGSLY